MFRDRGLARRPRAALALAMGRPPRFARLALVTLLACVATHGAHAFPILRAPRPVVDPKEAAASHLGVSPRRLFGSRSSGPSTNDVLNDASLTRLTHEVAGSGFHRRVLVDVEVLLPSQMFRIAAHGKCHVALVTELDPHLYADRFELDASARFKGPGHAASVFEDSFAISEKAAPDCNASVLVIQAPLRVRHFADTTPGIANASRVAAGASATFAAHNRYPGVIGAETDSFLGSFLKPRPGIDVTLDPPRALVRCGGDTNFKNEIPKGNWSVVTKFEPGAEVSDSVKWRVPAGTGAHAGFVARATLLFRFAAASYVLLAVWRAPEPVRFAAAKDEAKNHRE